MPATSITGQEESGRRWVIYDGANDGSRIPPDWQLWLRGTIDDLPEQGAAAGAQVPAEADSPI